MQGGQRMKIATVLLMSLVLMDVVYAADGIRILHIQNPRLPMPSEESGASIAKPKLVAEVKGAEFDAMRKEVEDTVKLLENKRTWWDLGPDASYMSAKITIGKMEYTLNSWFPLYRNNPKIAVSETRGLVVVSGKAKKDKIEDENSRKYKKLVGIFDKAMKRNPEYAVEGGTKDRTLKP